MKASHTSIRYSVVIPVYNSTRVLYELQERIDRFFSSRPDDPYEIVLVDDGSPNPGTWPALVDIAQKKPNINAIRLTRNFGQHTALLCGLKQARGAYVITMDDDLQHAPEDVAALIELQEHDVVIGQYAQKKHSLIRNLFSNLKARFDQALTGVPPDIRISTFCLIRRTTVRQILRTANIPYPLLSTLIFNVTTDVVGAPVQHSHRRDGKSGYSFFKLLQLFSRVLLNNTGTLFRFITWCGAGIGIVSLGTIFGLLLVEHLCCKISTWIYLGLLIVWSNGLFLFVAGLLGIAGAHNTAIASRKPPYLIRQQVFYQKNQL